MGIIFVEKTGVLDDGRGDRGVEGEGWGIKQS